jgi:HD-GYP domain-containing protein (c-di-GMP phosphodiesterase class II)
MAESIKISRAENEDSADKPDLGREYSEKLQTAGRTLVSSLYMLVRSAKLYDPENEVFEKPLRQLQDTVNQIIAMDSKLELQGVKESFYLNSMLVKVDANALDNQRLLLTEMRAKDVGGFTLVRPVTPDELRNFLAIFAKDQALATEEDGLASRRLVQMKVTKYSKLKDKLEKDELEPDDEKVDRKKYAMTCFARAVFFLRRYDERMRQKKPMAAARANRVVQDLVDVSYEQRSHFLGMTSMHEEADYHVFHQVNTCLMAIVFANELEFTKAQMRDVGVTALFHETGMSTLPEGLLTKPGALTPDEKHLVQRSVLETTRNTLAEKAYSRSSLTRLVATAEHKQEFGTAVKDSRGNVQMVIPKNQQSVFAKMVSICCVYDALTSKRPYRDPYGPEIALTLMWTEMRHKFDPELLRVFMKVMAIQPIRVLARNRQTVSIG